MKTSLFAQFALALGVGHAVGILMWALAAAVLVPRVAEEHLATILDTPMSALAERLAPADAATRQQILDELDDPRISLTEPLDDEALPDAGELRLDVAYPHVRVYRPIDATTWVALGPLRAVPVGAELRWIGLALLATVGVGIGAWVALRPVRRALVVLAGVAKAFGSGDLTARARVSGPAELREVGEAFDAMADRIHGLLRVQQETLQGVSHELRTPLTRARIALELVADTEAPERREELAGKVSGNLDQMERLLDELLAYLRLDAPQELATQATDLVALAESVVRESEPRIPVRVTGAGHASVEPRLLRRALRNLVSNAARHADGEVVVNIEVNHGIAYLHVDDDGPGIPADERGLILLPFRRGDVARSLDPRGAGLGLPIVARVGKAHGGTLDLDDSPLGGARVTLSIPVKPA
ncbi:MAG: ATP-binding protein [Myxococcota bacterium]